MIKKLGRSLINLLVGVNVVSVVLMLLCAYTATIHPEKCTWFAPFNLTFPAYVAATLFFLLWWAIFSPRFIWISVVGLVVGFQAVRDYCPINLPNPHPQGCIKVMSYNVEAFRESEYRQNDAYKKIVDCVVRGNADIVCMQEFSYYPNECGQTIDARLSRWPHVKSVKLGTFNALGLCSRYPIVRTHCVYFDGGSHGCYAFTLKVDGDTILVLNNHFPSNEISSTDKAMYGKLVKSPQNANIKNNVRYLSKKIARSSVSRAIQADTVAAFVANHPDCPIILCGDFNDSPISYTHHRMTEELSDAFVSSGLGPGISYHKAGMYFRLDNILYSEHWNPYSARVESENGYSDHYPISCYLKLKK